MTDRVPRPKREFPKSIKRPRRKLVDPPRKSGNRIIGKKGRKRS